MEVLSAPLKQPLQVRVQWALWKYAVLGEDIHFVSSGFEIKNDSDENWYRKVVGLEREHLLEQIDAGKQFTHNANNILTRILVVWGNRVKGKKRIFDEIESNKKQSPVKAPGSPTKPPSSKTKQAKQSPKPTAIVSMNSVPAHTTLKKLVIGHGTNIAVRADLPEDGFMIAQVTEQTVIDNIGTEDANDTEIPIRWYVEGRETTLRGFYCFPNWIATVQYGAVIHVGVKLSYDEAMDMYKIEQDYDALLELI